MPGFFHTLKHGTFDFFEAKHLFGTTHNILKFEFVIVAPLNFMAIFQTDSVRYPSMQRQICANSKPSGYHDSVPEVGLRSPASISHLISTSRQAPSTSAGKGVGNFTKWTYSGNYKIHNHRFIHTTIKHLKILFTEEIRRWSTTAF